MLHLKHFTFYTRGLGKRLRDEGLTSPQRQAVLLDMLTFWSPDDDKAVMFPSVETLTALAHAERTIQRTTAQLSKLGLLRVEVGGGRKSNRYFATD